MGPVKMPTTVARVNPNARRAPLEAVPIEAIPVEAEDRDASPSLSGAEALEFFHGLQESSARHAKKSEKYNEPEPVKQLRQVAGLAFDVLTGFGKG